MKKLISAAALVFALSAPAFAADMPLKAVPMVAAYNWTGFYIGGNAGYSWGRANTDQDDPATTTTTTRCFRNAALTDEITGTTTRCTGTTLTLPIVTTATTTTGTSSRANVDGFIGGLQAGYNWQFDRHWLAGLEADLQYSDQHGSADSCSAAGCPAGSAFGSASHRLRWFGTFRGRVGWLPTDRILLYATGGLVYGEINSDYTSGITGTSLLTTSSRVTRAGWTAGGGIEGALWDRWTMKGEYLYADYGRFGTALGTGSSTTVGPGINTGNDAFIQQTIVRTVSPTVSTRFIDNIIRIGLNYRLTP